LGYIFPMPRPANPIRKLTRWLPVPYLEAGVLVLLGIIAAYYG
jgi:hypothetical protein